MIDFRELEAFVWIVKLGSFGMAAKHLHITQPSISERIARLEGYLGEQVLRRDHRPVMPTLRGRELFRQAENMLEQRQNAVAQFRQPADYQGVFRIGVVETIAQSWLPEFLTEVSRRYPQMTIEMEVDGTPGLRQRLLNHELDLAFLMGPVNSDQIINRKLCLYPMAFVAHPALSPESAISDPRDFLEEAVLLSFSRESIPYRDLKLLLDELFIESPRIHCSSSIWTIARLAMAQSGIGVMPPIIVREELNAGRLVELSLPCRLPHLLFTASWPASYDADLAASISATAVDLTASSPWRGELAEAPDA